MDWAHSFDGIANSGVGRDFVIIDIPKNLAVLKIFITPSDVPPWNAGKLGFLNTFLNFSNTHLHEDGSIVLFYVYYAKLKTYVLVSQDFYEYPTCNIGHSLCKNVYSSKLPKEDHLDIHL
jgi:hypothetical protein